MTFILSTISAYVQRLLRGNPPASVAAPQVKAPLVVSPRPVVAPVDRQEREAEQAPVAAPRPRAQKPATNDAVNRPNPFLENIDEMSAQELADYLYALAEEIIASPEEYKVKMGLQQLDISDLDNIDLSTAAGRKKLAKLLRLLAEQALRGKEVYQASVVDKSKPGRGI